MEDVKAQIYQMVSTCRPYEGKIKLKVQEEGNDNEMAAVQISRKVMQDKKISKAPQGLEGERRKVQEMKEKKI